mmetsp:Transcript_8452/g.14927  ORF Transcript_8452/g.14927 Transcript_8452/m.14927 type:complete len:351 (+) Transcript_8452:44-1096(+)
MHPPRPGILWSLLFLSSIAVLGLAFTPNPIWPLVAKLPPPRQIAFPKKNSHEEKKNLQLFAKKKKGGKGKGGAKEKRSGFEWATSFSLKPFEATETRELASTAAASFESRTGKPLCEEIKGAVDIPKALWNAPSIACVIVGVSDEASPTNSNNKEEDEVVKKNVATGGDMIVKYANIAALETMGLKPEEYKRLISPSTLASDEDVQNKDLVSIDLPSVMKGEKRYEGGYKKKILRRQDEQGKDASISIVDAHRWALEKPGLVDGKLVTHEIGVAYAWERWTVGEGVICSPGGKSVPLLKTEDLENSITKQAMAIRTLKEEQGLGNKDPEVIDAVEELLRLKDMLAAMSEE